MAEPTETSATTKLAVYSNSWLQDCHTLDPRSMSSQALFDIFTRLKDSLYYIRLSVPDISDPAKIAKVVEAIEIGVDTLRFCEKFIEDDSKYHLNTRIKDVIQDATAFVKKYGRPAASPPNSGSAGSGPKSPTATPPADRAGPAGDHGYGRSRSRSRGPDGHPPPPQRYYEPRPPPPHREYDPPPPRRDYDPPPAATGEPKMYRQPLEPHPQHPAQAQPYPPPAIRPEDVHPSENAPASTEYSPFYVLDRRQSTNVNASRAGTVALLPVNPNHHPPYHQPQPQPQAQHHYSHPPPPGSYPSHPAYQYPPRERGWDPIPEQGLSSSKIVPGVGPVDDRARPSPPTDGNRENIYPGPAHPAHPSPRHLSDTERWGQSYQEQKSPYGLPRDGGYSTEGTPRTYVPPYHYQAQDGPAGGDPYQAKPLLPSPHQTPSGYQPIYPGDSPREGAGGASLHRASSPPSASANSPYAAMALGAVAGLGGAALNASGTPNPNAPGPRQPGYYPSPPSQGSGSGHGESHSRPRGHAESYYPPPEHRNSRNENRDEFAVYQCESPQQMNEPPRRRPSSYHWGAGGSGPDPYSQHPAPAMPRHHSVRNHHSASHRDRQRHSGREPEMFTAPTGSSISRNAPSDGSSRRRLSRHERDQSRDKERSRERDRSRHRSCEREKSRDRDRDRDRDRGRERSRSRHRRERDKEKEKEKEKEKSFLARRQSSLSGSISSPDAWAGQFKVMEKVLTEAYDKLGLGSRRSTRRRE